MYRSKCRRARKTIERFGNKCKLLLIKNKYNPKLIITQKKYRKYESRRISKNKNRINSTGHLSPIKLKTNKMPTFYKSKTIDNFPKPYKFNQFPPSLKNTKSNNR